MALESAAKVVELSFISSESFEDAVTSGLKAISPAATQAWVKEQRLTLEGDRTRYQVNVLVTVQLGATYGPEGFHI